MNNNKWVRSWFIENIFVQTIIFLILGTIALRWRTDYVVLSITIGILCLAILLAIIIHFGNKKKEDKTNCG